MLSSVCRNIVHALILVTLACAPALILAEFGATAYYFIKEGTYRLPRSRIAAERNTYVEVATPTGCSYMDSVLVHPYLAHAQSPLGPCGAPYTNSKSLIGKEYPDRPIPKTGIILVTGGSVAAQFVWDNRKTPSPLEAILNAEFTGPQYERFIVLNGAHGAWKQPNQYILFGLYADVLAGVITLDGFNEHYMIGASKRFEAPANNFFQVIEQQDPRAASVFAEIALKMDADLYRFTARHTLFHFSNFAYLIVDALRGGLRSFASTGGKTKYVNLGSRVRQAYDKMFAFQTRMSEEERIVWSLQQYEKYIRLMNAGAESLGIKRLFLLQPTPASGKPLTDREKPFAQATNWSHYKRMSDDLLSLKSRFGIPVYSLLDVFDDVHEDIYRDHIHVNNLGDQIMARRIADLIETTWGWPRHRTAASKAALTPSNRQGATQ